MTKNKTEKMKELFKMQKPNTLKFIIKKKI